MDVEQPRDLGDVAGSDVAGSDVAGSDVAGTAVLRAFLICDIRGYSTFTSQRGDEAAARLAMSFAGLARDSVVARGGRVVELRGDEAFAVFASPAQAVRAGLEMVLACVDETSARPDFPLPVGIGIDFGEAVPVEGGYRGAVINLAARLCSQASAGQVLVTPKVVDEIGDAPDLTFEPRSIVKVKGFDDPVETFEPLAGAGRSQPADAETMGAETVEPLPIDLDDALPMAGRDDELAWLRGTWRQALRGRGRVVLVTGPAGIGKTRLAAELASHVNASGIPVHYTGAGGAAGAETLSAVRAACSAPPGGLWILDDLNLSPESAILLADSAEELESRPVLIVGLFRDEGGEPALSDLADRLDHRGDGLRRLGPLDDEGVRAVARSYVIDIDDLPAEQILRASGGVPSRVHELVSEWSRDEAARRLSAAAEWLAAGKGRQAAGLRFADNVIALKLRRIYDTGTREQGADVCPYKGLGTFDESDAAYFFGREQLVGELAARTVGFGLLAVVGPSGSGKSSLVLAGLLPSLAAGLLPGSERWERVVLRPGSRPTEALDQALVGTGTGRSERLVLVIDQFEEVFTSAEDAADQAAFMGRLVELAGDPAVVVVLTIRADYTGHCAPYPELAELLSANLVLVGPMNGEQLRRAVELPARRVGLRVESALVDALVGEVEAEPGGLPLLSTALVQLWQARQGGWLRYTAYERTGGVRTAVARLAESSYEQLSDVEREIATSIFIRLVSQDEGESAVRRRVPLAEFDVDRDPLVADVLGRLTRDRLLTQGDGMVEVAHEALIREWPRFAGWLKEDAAGRELRGHLTRSATQWSERGRDDSDLYRGARLSASLDWSQGHDRALNALEREFLSHSRAASERQLERQRHTNRRLRGLLVGTAVFLVAALVAGLFALVQRNNAQSQALKSDAERVGTLAQTENNLDLSMLLAVAGVRLDDTPETRGDLLAALQRNPTAIHIIRPSSSEITAVAISPDGQLMATGDAVGAVRFENLKSWKQSGAAVRLPAPVPPLAVRFSPDGHEVVAASGRGDLSQVWLIDVASRQKRLIGSWPGPVAPIPNGSTTLAFSPDGTEIAVGLSDWPFATAGSPVSEKIALLNAKNGRVVWQRSYPLRPGQLEPQVAFTPSGTLVTSAEQGNTDVWNTSGGQIIRRFPVGGRFALSPDGRFAAIALNNRLQTEQTPTSLVLLNLLTGRERLLESLPNADWMATLAFTPDGKTLVGGSLDGDVRLWDLGSGLITQTFTSESGGRVQVGVDPSGRTLLAGSDDGSVIAWDLSGQQTLQRSFAWSTPSNSCPFDACMAINPAGTTLATDESDGTVDLIDLRTYHWYATLPATDGSQQLANGLTFTPDGRQLITGDTAGRIIFWDAQNLSPVRRLQVSDPVQYLAVSPDGKFLAVEMQDSSATNSRVEVLDMATGSTLHSYPVAGDAAGLGFSFDGRELTSLGSGIDVRDVASGHELFSPSVPGEAESIALSPTSPELAVGTADGKIYLFDVRSGRASGAPITAAASNVLSLAYSSDGRLLAAALRDGTTVLVDRASGELLGNPFPKVTGALPTVLFAPNRDLVINYIGTALAWPTDVATLERYACQVAGRDITPAEWANVLPNRPYQHVCP